MRQMLIGRNKKGNFVCRCICHMNKVSILRFHSPVVSIFTNEIAGITDPTVWNEKDQINFFNKIPKSNQIIIFFLTESELLDKLANDCQR